jgi:hypothetical protein
MPLNYVFLLEKMGCKLSLKTLSVTLILHLAIPSLKNKSYLIFNFFFLFLVFFSWRLHCHDFIFSQHA